MEHVKVVAFDCDGVLFDTERVNRVYYSHILRQFGRPTLTDEEFHFVQMHTVYESLAYLFPDKKGLAAAHDFRNSMDYHKYLSYLTVEPYLVPLLEKIKPQKKTAIATNRSDTMDRLLAEFNLDEYFDLVVTSNDVKRPKPHPDGLIKILDYFDLAPHHVIYVGDSELDELAANAAKIPLVAYRNRKLSSPYHINNLQELEALLNV